MKYSIHLNFTIDLQPGKYNELNERMDDLIRELEDLLTSDCNHTVAGVCGADWNLTISPD